MRTLTYYRKLGKRKTRRSAEECRAVAQARAANKPYRKRASIVQWVRGDRTKLRVPLNVWVLPLGDSGVTSEVVYDRRKKNYKNPQPTWHRSNIVAYNEGRYSSRCHYIRYSYVRWVESWGCLISSQHIYYRVHTNDGIRHGIIKAPRGWSFTADDLGIKIAKGKMEWHITASDVACGAIKLMCDKARANYAAIQAARKAQREQERREKDSARAYKGWVDSAAKEGVYVCMTDATRNGNCHGGVQTWANRHGLDITKHYLPTTIAKFGTDESKRTKLVIMAAIRRHAIEMEQGYCHMAYHIPGYAVE